jgi:HEPN domain-containing protein
MSPNEKVFKKEYAKELFSIAENDFVTACELAKSPSIRKETILFHLEQTIEKALKACLVQIGIPVPFTHDLYAIVQKFPQNDLPPGGYSLHDLTPYATVKRYEEGNFVLTNDDVNSAKDNADAVLKWARPRIQK